MTQLPPDLSYGDWIAHIFDHPVDHLLPVWYFEVDAPWWDETASPARALDYLTRLLDDPLPVLEPYSDAQVNQGLWYLLSQTQHFALLWDERLPLEDRLAAVQAIEGFFAQEFLPRCMDVLGHLDEPGAAPLNSACYMWWDIMGALPAPEDPARHALDEAVLAVMAGTLRLDSVACQESALHGLGHWRSGYPEQIAAIIEDYLQTTLHLLPGLQAYARSAASGCVL